MKETNRITLEEVAELFRSNGIPFNKWNARRWLHKRGLKSFGPTKFHLFWDRAAVMAAFNRDMNPQLVAA